MKRLFAVVPNLLLAAVTLLVPVFTVQAQSVAYGVSTDNQLVRRGGGTTIVGSITGMDSVVKGLDFRPATGQLYALSASSKLYIIDRRTAVATLVAPLTVAIVGNRFGFDFDPVADRIRIFGLNQNLNVNPNDGTVVVETPLNPGSQIPVDAAYSNSYKGATSTTLYVLAGGSLNVVNTPSSGTLTQLGLTISFINSMDIQPVPATTSGLLAIQTGVVKVPGAVAEINLTNGAVPGFSPLSNSLVLDSIAIMPDRLPAAKVDYDRDKRTDYSVFRPSSNSWYALRSTDNTFTAASLGIAGDILTPGDYDGDEQMDIAVWRPSTGDFYVRRSGDGVTQFFHFGQNGDEPVPQDFDGDGRTDFAVVRRAGGLTAWYYTESSSGIFRAVNWGLDTDKIAPADYDGDGKCDIAIRRGSGAQPATFYILGSTAGYYGVQWGLGSDAIVPGDYDGDGKSDLAVVRLESTYKWYILKSSNQTFISYQLGAPPHVLATGDYDSDGKTDPTVFIPSAGDFYTIRSSSGALAGVHFGQNGDVPVAKYDAH
jgi:hypothetical protein